MKLLKKILLYVVILTALIVVCVFPLNVRYGIDGVVYTKKIPLYAKLGGYLYRDWMYRDIVNDITRDIKDDTARALAIMEWTNKNIKNGIPEGLKSLDDHPLNIIIRQYGGGDQIEDVFTILCSYAGMKSGMAKCFNHDKSQARIFSLVNIDGRWLIFEAGKSRYFYNKDGGIASVDDYIAGRMVLSSGDAASYKEFLDSLKDVDCSSFTRPDEQMPVRRLPAVIKRIFRAKSGSRNSSE